jgi:hypothetical protein
VLVKVWEAAGYPWSVRLKALLPLWLPALRQRLAFSAETERQLLAISPRQIDRRLKPRKSQLRRRLYGRTKPGTLLKHHIPIKTDHWDVRSPGFTEIDLVSHSGDCAQGEFAHSFNLTDIHTTWTETRAGSPTAARCHDRCRPRSGSIHRRRRPPATKSKTP